MSTEAIIQGCEDALSEFQQFVVLLNADQYTALCTPYFHSAIGQHARHVLDMFHAVKQCLDQDTTVVNYDHRRRGAKVETDPHSALSEINGIKQWVATLKQDILMMHVTVLSETHSKEEAQASLPSTLARELHFVASHSVHHLALMASIAKCMDITVDDSVGIAPATATFMRQAHS